MSSSSSSNRRRSTSTSRISEDQINELVAKLQALLPDSYRSSGSTARVPSSKVLKETCNYIKRLHREVDGLSERLSQVLASVDSINGVDVDFVRSLLQQ